MDTYVQASCVPFSPKNIIPEVTRRSANYHPTVWGDHFLKYASDGTKSDGGIGLQLGQLKEEVRKMLVGSDLEPAGQQLKLIDAIQRLGVSYHFESEIDVALKNHLVNSNGDDDLYTIALHFRLLRQRGHHVSCDVFNKFKDSEGKFKKSLINDTQGLLSLYESSHLRVHGEDVLDEVLEFTTTHLEQMLYSLSNNSNSNSNTNNNNNTLLASQVVYALNMPIHKGLTRLKARHYIPIYEQDSSHNKTLLRFAKLDFNMLQKVHQRELGDMTRWWKDLNFKEKLPFARDRLVECYFWILGVYFEPQYFLGRKFLTKVIAMASVLDDIYDVYGTLEELILFTDAIDRWDISALDELPEYMGVYYEALVDVYGEMEEKLSKEERSYQYQVHYAKDAMKELAKAYLEEAKWYNEGYVPRVEEHMEIAVASSGYKMVATTAFVGMGELVTKQTFDWVSNNPLIVRAASLMARLTDDMVGHQFEQERGHVASAVECYMKQHTVTKEATFVEFNKRITNAWKDMNQECLDQTMVPMALLERVLNLARVINLLYRSEDGFTHSKTRVKDFITSLLIDSVPV